LDHSLDEILDTPCHTPLILIVNEKGRDCEIEKILMEEKESITDGKEMDKDWEEITRGMICR
jgi:hypothetical protein